MAKYNKLELTWFNKDKVLVWDKRKNEYIWVEPEDIRVAEARIFKEKKVIGEPNSIWDFEQQKWIKSPNKIPKEEQNLIIKGDNLLGLRALEDDFVGRIKLIYIDPPFNTGSRINADGEEVGYDDGLEHSIWLSMMKNRLDLLYDFLSEDGFICVHLDDRELCHSKIILDEIFTRSNFFNIITLTTNAPSGFKATGNKIFSTSNFILVYGKSKEAQFHKLFIEKEYDKAYSKYLLNRDEHYSKWKWSNLSDCVAQKLKYKDPKEARNSLGKDKFEAEIANFAIENPENVFRTAAIQGGARAKRLDTINKSKQLKNKVLTHPNDDIENFYIVNGEMIIFYENRIMNIDGEKLPGQILTDVWTDISWTGIANEGRVKFKNSKKPELLLRRILQICTNENDWVLDSFAGSGTTGAVAHKMGRKWIMIEMAKHAETHCLPRLKAVIEGKEQDNFAYGGGFRYVELGESLFKRDNGIIGINYDNGDLVEAVCKIEGFKFIGREFLEKAKLHGVVNQKRYCHVTEEFVTQDLIDELAQELKEGESLAIYCMKKMSRLTLPQNIQVKKIPRDIIKKFKLGA